jgi:2-iminobutanoate/2-iminopropanoate deaminase
MIKRQSVDVEGLGHAGLPIPAAARVGVFIATGGVRGVSRKTGEMPADLAEQVHLMFANLRTIVEAAGGACEGILKMTIWIRGNEARTMIDQEWLAMFPDAQARPARHILVHALGAGMLVQCEALAIAE